MMVRTAIAGLTCSMALVAAPAARADDQSFFDYIHAHGVPATYGIVNLDPPDYSNRKAGEAICDVLHHGGGRDGVPFLGMQQNQYRDILIDGAQHNLCPDTLH
jgi:hypothetical protein